MRLFFIVLSFVILGTLGVVSNISAQTIGASCAFTRDLGLGARGEDVRCLQKYLNSRNFSVATQGSGSVGQESTYFGFFTRQAVVRWQQAEHVEPVFGYFGFRSRMRYFSIILSELSWKLAPPAVTGISTSSPASSSGVVLSLPQLMTSVPTTLQVILPTSQTTLSQPQVVHADAKDQEFLTFTVTPRYSDIQNLTSVKITVTSTTPTKLHASTLRNVRLYRDHDAVPFASVSEMQCMDGTCTHTFSAPDNLLPAPFDRTVTISVRADLGPERIVDLGDTFRFQIATSSDIQVKSIYSGTAGSVVGIIDPAGTRYLAPFEVVISEYSPILTTTLPIGSGVVIGVFKVTNLGKAPVTLTHVNFSDGGTTNIPITYDLYASEDGGGPNDASIAYATNSAGVAFGALANASFDRTIYSGSFRYLTVKTRGISSNYDTHALYVNALGDLRYSVAESDIGYSGNPSSDSDILDTITGLFVHGKPALGTVTLKD